jgi:hypothetical protein
MTVWSEIPPHGYHIMNQIYISLPFYINRDHRQEFFDFCKKNKIQIIKEYRDNKIVAWKPDDFQKVSIRFKDTVKFDLNTDREFYKFMDAKRLLFVRFFISGRYDRMIELYELDNSGNFVKLTPNWYNVIAGEILDFAWIINQTSHFGFKDLYDPKKSKE